MKSTKLEDRRAEGDPRGLRTRADDANHDARRLIDQIEVRRQELDAIAFKRPGDGRGRRMLLGVAIVVSAAFLALDVYAREDPPPAFSQEELGASLEFAVYLTVLGVEEFRDRTGALPTTLEQAGLDDPAIRYVVGTAGFRIEARQGGRVLEFAEGDDLKPLEASFWTLQRRRAE